MTTCQTSSVRTTHVGSLTRPDDLIPLLYARERGDRHDPGALADRIRSAVAELVARQREIGLDIVNDGEASKVLYSTYVQDRLSGFSGDRPDRSPSPDIAEFPGLVAARQRQHSPLQPRFGVCTGPIAYRGEAALASDLANLRAAVGPDETEAFMSAASPGVVALILANDYYGSDREYVEAVAAAMKTEYDAIHAAGFILQLDCPDLTLGYRGARAHQVGLEAFRAGMRERIAALNQATRDIPPERMRLHVCWGNSPNPHHYDVELRAIVDILLEVRPAGLSFEAANPRHAHEWAVWREIDLPPGKYLIPGVVDSTTNFIEHPDLVAERIARFADIVGPERVVAGVDCGLATKAGSTLVDPGVAWKKLESLVEGARRANGG